MDGSIEKRKVITVVLFLLVLAVTYIVINFGESIFVYNSDRKVAREVKDMDIVIGGEAVGIKLLATGVLVMAVDRDDTPLMVSDIILSIDGKKVESNNDIVKILKEVTTDEVYLEVDRKGDRIYTSIKLLKDDISGENRLGLWVKDSSAGVGTITFYDRNSLKFGSLGHGVTETKENYILPITSGGVTKTLIYSIKKGEVKDAGEIKGTLSSILLGDISFNTENGVFGYLTEDGKKLVEDKESIKVCPKSKIKEGEAYIYCTLDNNTKEKYKVVIEKVMISSNTNKNMIIKIVDEKLLEKTGGIVQGMSGSPIVQEGKLVGAVTHVFLNDPTRGYGVFIENMIEDMKEN